jgi:RimJ/RimL family protein N-acetyltransferase
VTGFIVEDGFCPFDGALRHSLDTMRRSSHRDRPWWTPRLLILNSAAAVIGVIGFKGPPREGMVEVGYSVAPAFRNRGFATEALCAVTGHAIRFGGVKTIRAHTMPEPTPSTRVLEKGGFQKITEIIDPEDGLVWRWERTGLPV